MLKKTTTVDIPDISGPIWLEVHFLQLDTGQNGKHPGSDGKPCVHRCRNMYVCLAGIVLTMFTILM